MPRANRYYQPGYLWHITHRCHKKEFLLKLVKDRQRFLHWLFQAKKRYDLSILNYIVTSNHIHLLVDGGESHETISKSIQLIAGRTGQEYNQRKNRKGAFWEDRYHATAIQSDKHLFQCICYIDMNMVRAGVVKHPHEWVHSGYNEIQNPRRRYSLINHKKLMKLLNFNEYELLTKTHSQWIENEVNQSKNSRDKKWTEAVAVGDNDFVEKTAKYLDERNKKLADTINTYHLKEDQATYNCLNRSSFENTYYWDF
ncbi:Transposase IS200-like protein [Candidatus Magnetomorum sp. HK-1]|nr:Transposase IS200-like protein [Candidatus Magnetomorum sp. HK-1]